MGVTAIVGGQFGSEGKGKIAAYLAPEMTISIRTGGPNAGHTVEHRGSFYKLQSVPCAFVHHACLLAIGAGAVIDEQILRAEISCIGLDPRRLVIDRCSVAIRGGHRLAEQELVGRIGSTGKGVGAALAGKVLRAPSTV